MLYPLSYEGKYVISGICRMGLAGTRVIAYEAGALSTELRGLILMVRFAKLLKSHCNSSVYN